MFKLRHGEQFNQLKRGLAHEIDPDLFSKTFGTIEHAAADCDLGVRRCVDGAERVDVRIPGRSLALLANSTRKSGRRSCTWFRISSAGNLPPA